MNRAKDITSVRTWSYETFGFEKNSFIDKHGYIGRYDENSKTYTIINQFV